MSSPFERLSSARHRFIFILGLIVAGEAVYALPFQITRFFRPTVLEVFDLTATELGLAQGVYGIVAMIAYFPGGALADRFPARKLMAMSLWSTAAGGIYLSSFPGLAGTTFIWGFFGITTVLLFWAALIRATRDWGGPSEQGRAYGILDGGRGLLAAALASIGTQVFALSFPDGYALATMGEKENALRLVINGYTLVTALTGFFIWFALKGGNADRAATTSRVRSTSSTWSHITHVLKLPAVWLQSLIVFCAYVGYKGLDNYSLFAVQVYGLDEVEAAQVMTLSAWVRPVAALCAGLLGDRFNVSRMLIYAFLILLVSDLFFAYSTPVYGAAWVLLANTVLACIAIFGLRGLYFAVFEEARVPITMTGTAVGIVSVVGYTPDIFVAFVAGLFIDNYPGITGHQYFFMFLAAFALSGMCAALALRRVTRPETPPVA